MSSNLTGTGERAVPYDEYTEQVCIGAFLLDREAVIAVVDWLEPGHFYRDAHAWIYDVVRTLYQRREPPDIATVAAELDRRGQLLAVGGVAYLAQCLNRCPSAIHAAHYGHVVERTGILRRLITVGGQIAGLGYEDGQELDDVLDQAERLLLTTTQARKRGAARDTTDADAVTTYMDGLQARLRGEAAPSGWRLPGLPRLSALTRGCRPGKLWVITGESGGGKSTLVSALGLALKAAGARMGLFSLEMDDEELAERELGALARVDTDRLAAGQLTAAEQDRVVAAYARLLDQPPIRLVTGGGFSPRDIAAQARRWQADGGLHVLGVDYLGLVARPRRGNDTAELDDVINGFKNLAGELGSTVIVPTQLGKSAVGKDAREWDDYMRGSQAIKHAADVIIAIEPEGDKPPDPTQPWRVHLHVTKHRGGKTGSVPALWWLAYNRIAEVDTDHEDY